MKRFLTVLLALSLALAMFVGCTSQNSSATPAPSEAGDSSAQDQPATDASQTEEDTGVEDGEMKRVGVVQLVEHAALDSAYRGFVDGLKELGYEEGKNIAIDYNNAQGEQANCNTIAEKLVNDQNDVILAIATPAALAAANATKEIPVLVTAVTDPADAKLVASNEAPGGNVTGTSDLTPCAQQIGLVKKLVPEAKVIGMLYSTNEANSIFQVGLAKAEAEKQGLQTVDYTFSNTNELQQVVESMMGKVDAIYSPTDNMVAVGMPTISKIATENKIPCIVGEAAVVENGGLATYSIDYYELGKLTAAQAVRIFEGAEPKDMPIEYQENFTFHYNEKIAQELGITIPEDLLN